MQDGKKVYSVKMYICVKKTRCVVCGVRRESAVSGMSHLKYE